MQSGFETDSTVFDFSPSAPAKNNAPNLTPVALAPGAQPPGSPLYVAQQTSLQEFTPGLNPQVNAASHLLIEIIRLNDGKLGDVSALRTRLEAGVRSFEAQAFASETDHAQVMAARYVLCTALDEAVTTSQHGDNGEWSKQSLLSTFHNETWGGEKFFQVLERCMQQPARNLYLLELMYLLLSLGFEGKYRVMDRGAIALESLRDKLYRQLRLLRGEPNFDLSKKLAPARFKDKNYTHIPWWMILIFFIVFVSIVYFAFSYTLDQRSAVVLDHISIQTSAREVN
ncbi:MAG: type IVB secretion system protein IcmH/DotU [Desulfarculales bacterium]|jgi:type VI secretion system protein ImpK|nr:type IVB secretion system protein IcmH/DotU [Desulfarculales bacterium]